MGILNKAIEAKRQKLIDLLISSGVYKVNNKQLYKLTLSELQDEFRRLDNNE
ncbi:hypothetical protein J2S74_000905 [Evansella vedderi]|uniref:Fur-regulated basic protein FbpA n=2 Tax=Evansella vedderi TaxID=38282 RepID=A0ABT9ZQL2_9BACI|nr:hypothetical protein [Evansella vedderi]